MMQRPEGYRCPGSGYGRPHGKHQREERARRAKDRAEAKAVHGKAPAVSP